MSEELSRFLHRFAFDRGMAGSIGLEREHVLTTPEGVPVPRSPEFLKLVDRRIWTYDLPATQVEDRTSPTRSFLVAYRALLSQAAEGRAVAAHLGLRLVPMEVSPESMPLVHFPLARYAQIAQEVGEVRLRAAMRTAGTHVHYGASSWPHALDIYHALGEVLGKLQAMGDNSNGLRLHLYRIMAPQHEPPAYESIDEIFEVYRARDFLEDPRRCHDLIRINPCGTVEVRAFGLGLEEEVMEWATVVERAARV